MTGFLLSPGITPALVGACSVEIPLAFGLAYVFFRGRGLEVAIGLNTVGLAAIKIYTDYADLYDLLLAVVILAAGLVWLVLSFSWHRSPARLIRGGSMALATLVVPLGAIKVISDFYDPFDIFLACLGILAGAFLLRWSLSGPSWLRYSPRRTGLIIGGSVVAMLALLLAEWARVLPTWMLLVFVLPFPILTVVYSR
ncbi:MAG: hypothetical protein L3K14_01215 [Thermoplasmata archaeon]|nr:hypothetical protein [Thermoplasmata archaeon]